MGQCESMGLSSVAFLFGSGFGSGVCFASALVAAGFKVWVVASACGFKYFPPAWPGMRVLCCACCSILTRQKSRRNSKSVLAPLCCRGRVDVNRILQALPSSLEVVSAWDRPRERLSRPFHYPYPRNGPGRLAGKRLLRGPAASSLLSRRNARDAGAQHKVQVEGPEQSGDSTWARQDGRLQYIAHDRDNTNHRPGNPMDKRGNESREHSTESSFLAAADCGYGALHPGRVHFFKGQDGRVMG
ncbi:hypothetical protein CCMA1212_000418 [Trichoderma ghanense]|uniref:Uncharacterized protein n=1 Tax=Trichoderma ghanense TaxID=65468 RepID=A0ABY2HH99_9HYPO